MLKSGILAMLLALILTWQTSAQDNSDAQIKPILDRAAQAMGGADRLAKYTGISWKGKGKFRQANIALVFDGEAFVDKSERFRQDLLLGENQGTSVILIVAGAKAWVKAGQTMPLPELLSPLRSNFYALSLAQRPHALRDKTFKLTPIGEVQVEGKTTLGLRAARKDWPDVTLYYDKESGLPVKSEVRVKDPTSAQEASDEFFLSDYKDFGGLKHYTKMVGKRDGNEYLEREFTEVRWHEQLPDNLFAMP